jgi:hypothetical protein
MQHQDLTWLTLSAADAKRLTDFCRQHQYRTIFVCKDEYGAYVGAPPAHEHETPCIFYFPGCDPSKNEHWYVAAAQQFGMDIFSEQLPLAVVADVERLGLGGVRFHVTGDDIQTHYFIREEAA